jgi:signal transduction histidine kinase
MDPQFLPRATERFSRADIARTTPGTGLGLSLTEAITRTHQGHLRLCANTAHHHTDPHVTIACTHPGIGTTITVLLPATRTNAEQLAEEPTPATEPAISDRGAPAPLEAS